MAEQIGRISKHTASLEAATMGKTYAMQQLKLQEDSVVSDPLGRKPYEEPPKLIRSLSKSFKSSLSRGSWQNTWSAPKGATDGMVHKMPLAAMGDGEDEEEGADGPQAGARRASFAHNFKSKKGLLGLMKVRAQVTNASSSPASASTSGTVID
jgi:hypothetical protein